MTDPPILETTHRVVAGDSRKMTDVGDGSVQLVVTSPPYPMIEMWDALFAGHSPEVRSSLDQGDGWRAFEGMHAILDGVWAEAARLLTPGGFLCVNIGDATRTIGDDFAIYPNHARILTACLRHGFQPMPAVIWRKQTNAPNKFMGSGMLPGGAYVTLEHEFILILRKGGKRAFTAAEKQRRRASAYFWEERNQWFSDVWDFKGERQDIGDPEVARRSAAYPLELPHRLIAMYSMEGDMVFDPFLGTGTTSIAALGLGRNSLGCEIDPAVAKVARTRLQSSPATIREKASARLAAHLAFVEDRTSRGKGSAHKNSTYGFPVITAQEAELRLLDVAELTTEAEHLRARHRMARLQPRLEVEERQGPARTLTAWTA